MSDPASSADKKPEPGQVGHGGHGDHGGQGLADAAVETCLHHLEGKPEPFRDSCDIILVLDTGEKLPAHKCALLLSRSSNDYSIRCCFSQL